MDEHLVLYRRIDSCQQGRHFAASLDRMPRRPQVSVVAFPAVSAIGYLLPGLWLAICFCSVPCWGQFSDLPSEKTNRTGPVVTAASRPASAFSGEKAFTPVGQEGLAPTQIFRKEGSAREGSDETRRSGGKLDFFDDVFQIPQSGNQLQQDSAAPRPAVRPAPGDSRFQVDSQPSSGVNPRTPLPEIQPSTDWSDRFVSRPMTQPATIRQVERTQEVAEQPWWQKQLAEGQPTGDSANALRITVDQLVLAMLQFSPEIRALQQEPMIASTYVDVENARFDPISFLESKWEDSNEPVGSTLNATRDGAAFVRDNVVTLKGGLRKKTNIGTEIELAQNLGYKNSNLAVFEPQNQETARLVLNIDQPLLNGAGRMVGTSRILLAQIDTGISEAQYAEQLQNKILSVIRAYWEFYYQSTVLVLRTKNYEAAVEILKQLKGRESFDAQRSQIIRAEAAVAARKLELIRSRADVRNAQTLLRELTRDPRLGRMGVADSLVLIPGEFPSVNQTIYPELSPIVSVAFNNRPEITEAMEKIKAASIQNDVAKNQLLPQLNLIMNMYSAALNGDSTLGPPVRINQFGHKPGYSAGIVLEYPIYNRAALARKRRVEAQLTKLSAELDDTLGNITAEVEIAHRELKLAFEATAESKISIEAAERDQDFIQKRWQNFAFLQNPDIASPTIFLEQLLDAQDRITQAQIQYANASRQFMTAVAELRKAEGSLLNYQSVVPGEEGWSEDAFPEATSPDMAPLSEQDLDRREP